MRSPRFPYGSICIVAAAAAVGLGSNLARPDGLALIRKPLKETRATATKAQIMGAIPVAADAHKKAPVAPIAAAKPDASPPPAEPQMKTLSVAESKPAASNPKSQESSDQMKQKKPKVEALFTTLADAKSFYDQKTATFIDARPLEDYEAEHIPGAISLYYDRVDSLYEHALGSVPKDRLIVTYCSDIECESATKLADLLVARGHVRVVILLEGLPGWKEAGYDTASGKEVE